jgi:hypothetical protein
MTRRRRAQAHRTVRHRAHAAPHRTAPLTAGDSLHVQDNAVRDAFRIGDSIDDRMGPEGRRSRYNTASDVTLEKKKKKRAAEEEQEEAEEDKPKKKVKKSPKVQRARFLPTPRLTALHSSQSE